MMGLTLKNAYGKLAISMVHHNNHRQKIPKLSPLLAAAVMVVSVLGGPILKAKADSYDDQIKAKQAEQAAAAAQASSLGAQAGTVQGQVNDLQTQIASTQSQIDINVQTQNALNKQIDDAKAKLAEQKDLLSANIKSMYIASDITPLEMVASSRNLGDFVDQQEARDRIKNSITDTLDTISKLKDQLDQQQKQITQLIDSQTLLRNSLADQESQAAGVLSQLNQDKASFDAQVKQKTGEITALRAQQRAANQSHGGAASPGDPSKGGYPAKWANAAQDSLVDNWGMYNRECVSYTAWRVYNSGRSMPRWGGSGNANQWPGNASAAGIGVDGNPRVGDVAIGYWGPYGHAMYVEAVNGNSVYVSQYNYGLAGEYSEMWVSASGLRFIHF